MRNLLLLVALLYVSHAFSQNYPNGYFTAPLGIDLALSGTFGELRANHYHSGVDLKTQGREGLPVYAAAAGYVARIKVSAYGYGKALYIAHPNGFTTVYAHLKQFTPEIEAWVKRQQYAKNSFEVDLFPPQIFSFKQGDTIAQSGNTGGSGGPHLHFEIRDTRTEETINPALFGLPIKDSRRPIIHHLYATPITLGTFINGKSTQQEIELTNTGNGVFTGELTASGTIGFVVHTVDQQDLSANNNGIYKLTQLVNDTPTYTFEIERFAFDETRYINAHMDFSLFKQRKQLAHKCYVEPGDKFSGYRNVLQNGLLVARPNKTIQVTLIVADAWGNKSEIHLLVHGLKSNNLYPVTATEVPWNQPNTMKVDAVTVQLSSGTLYRNTQLNIKKAPPCTDCLTPVYKIGDYTLPAHKRYTLRIHKSALTTHDKLIWASISATGEKSGLTTTWEGEWLTAHPREFGNFAVVQDTQAPRIQVHNFTNGKAVKNGQQLRLTATDSESGITFYEARIDENWVLLEHDAKRNLWWHTFDETLLQPGNHTIAIRMKDEVGNTSTWQSVFSYNP